MPNHKEKTILTQVVEKYRDLPLLWDKSHELYNKQEARKAANEKLLEIYRLYDPGATLKEVKKKIFNMRTSYVREYQKVMKSQLSEEDMYEYVPTLWYYDSFSFLNVNENVSFSSNSIKRYVSAYYNDRDEEDEEETEERIEEETEENYNILKTEDIFTAPPPNKKKRKPSVIYFTGDDQESNPIDDQPSRNSLNTSSTESFSKTIGIQLDELKPMQRFIAEKLMSEIIFYGRLDRLQPSTALNINPNDFIE